MGGKAVPNHPDYQTRAQAAKENRKSTDRHADNNLGHIAYRRIGEYQRSGKLPSEPIASGRTKQFHKKDLLSFALEVFDVEVDAFKMTELPHDYEQYKKNENQKELTFIKDIESILHLHERHILEPDETLVMIKQTVSKFKADQ